ncbi:MAG: histidine kinase dimerization/phospho-acceptor domain-containing protein [Sarcina sp.]
MNRVKLKKINFKVDKFVIATILMVLFIVACCTGITISQTNNLLKQKNNWEVFTQYTERLFTIEENFWNEKFYENKDFYLEKIRFDGEKAIKDGGNKEEIKNNMSYWERKILNSKKRSQSKLNPKRLGFYYLIKDSEGKSLKSNYNEEIETMENLINNNPISYIEFEFGDSEEKTVIKNSYNFDLADQRNDMLNNLYLSLGKSFSGKSLVILENSDTSRIGTSLFNGVFNRNFFELFNYKMGIFVKVMILILFLSSLSIPFKGRNVFVKNFIRIPIEIKLVLFSILGSFSFLLFWGYGYFWIIANFIPFIAMIVEFMNSFLIRTNSMVLTITTVTIIIFYILLVGRDLRRFYEGGLKTVRENSLIMKVIDKFFKKKKKEKKERKTLKKTRKLFLTLIDNFEKLSLAKKVICYFSFLGIYVFVIVLGIVKTIFGITFFGDFYLLYDIEKFGGLILFSALVIGFPIVLFLIIKRFLRQLREIKDSTEEIAEGNFEVQLREKNNSILNPISENLSNIKNSFSEAIESELKSERMKSELITNVSEDLKLPLNEIIAYVELLREENISKEQEERYLKILEKKSKNLKGLIENLFEATKASTGNIKLNIEKVNIVAVLRQTLGEFEEEIQRSNLEFKVNMPSEKVTLNLDGARTWRVFENLISNVLKYSLEGSRVYLNLYKKEDEVIFEMKNIAGYELNCTLNELREKMRNSDLIERSEGAGLGLSIANSLVELQGGKMDIDIEGDLFKVIIAFKES